MKASFTAMLVCLCTQQACAMPPAPAAPRQPVAVATAAAAPRHTALSEEPPAPDADRRTARKEGASPPPPSPARERGLLLAGFALMAGITLRRMGDGSP